jgi:hypothetical protein
MPKLFKKNFSKIKKNICKIVFRFVFLQWNNGSLKNGAKYDGLGRLQQTACQTEPKIRKKNFSNHKNFACIFKISFLFLRCRD